jgi:hypothetical protein
VVKKSAVFSTFGTQCSNQSDRMLGNFYFRAQAHADKWQHLMTYRRHNASKRFKRYAALQQNSLIEQIVISVGNISTKVRRSFDR